MTDCMFLVVGRQLFDLEQLECHLTLYQYVNWVQEWAE